MQAQSIGTSEVDWVPSLVYWKDRDGFYHGCNQACRDSVLLTTPFDDIQGLDDFDLFSESMACAFRADDQYVVEQGIQKISHENFLVDNLFVQQVTCKQPVYNKNGVIIGVSGRLSQHTKNCFKWVSKVCRI